MTVGADSPLRHKHEGTTYHFFNPSCLNKFLADPAKYLPSVASSDSGNSCDTIEPTDGL